MQIKSCFAILIGLSVIFSSRCSSPQGRQMPQPDLSALKDDIGTLPRSSARIPTVMVLLHYYTEMMQYEQVKNPIQADPITTTKRPYMTTQRTTTTERPTTTKAKPTTTTTRTTTTRPVTTTTRKTTTRRTTKTTTQRPTTPTTTRRTTVQQNLPYTTEINIWHNPPMTQKPHKPGNYAPEKPPYWTYFGIPMKPEQGYHKPGVQRPQQGINVLSDPNWKDPAFIQWFFQPKPKEIETFDENDLQYLDPLPKKLLLDIYRESDRPPALLDIDNVNEFRKKYDDSFYPRYRNNVPNIQHIRMKMRLQMQQQRPMLTGRKKPPPTRPYVHMLMLYDLLKREAKSQKLHQFGGFTTDLLAELNESSKQTGDQQMKYWLESLLEAGEITAADVLSRVNFVLTDLKDEKSETSRALKSIPPLVFLP